MIGYRVFGGPHGTERALTGQAAEADDETLIAAILGEEIEAPGADALFPEGHASTEAISRLLARMIGRLPNSAPYSNADVAQRAFASVMSNPVAARAVPETTAENVATVSAVSAPPPMAQSKSGVSPAIAIMLFGGIIVSAAAAVHFYLQADSFKARLTIAATTYIELKDDYELEQAIAADRMSAFETVTKAHVAVAEARFNGAEIASRETAEAFATAVQQLEEADAMVRSDQPS